MRWQTTIAGGAILAATLGLGVPAAAHHHDCEWGVTADTDSSEADPVKVRPRVPAWGCTGPVVTVTAKAGDREASAEATGSDVDWSLESAGDRSDPESPPPSTYTGTEPTLRLRVTPRRVRAGRRTRFRFTAAWVHGADVWRARGVVIRFAGRRARTGGAGRATIVARLRRPGVRRAVAYDSGLRRRSTTIRVTR